MDATRKMERAMDKTGKALKRGTMKVKRAVGLDPKRSTRSAAKRTTGKRR